MGHGHLGNYGLIIIKDTWELFNVAIFMYICQTDNCLSHCLIFVLSTIFLSNIICSRFPFAHVLYPLINGSADSPNHSVLDFKDPFNHLVQQLSNTQCTPSKNRSLVVLIAESSCQSSFCLRSYLPSQGHIIPAELM